MAQRDFDLTIDPRVAFRIAELAQEYAAREYAAEMYAYGEHRLAPSPA